MSEHDRLMAKHKGLAVFFFNQMYLSRWDSLKHTFPPFVDSDDVLQACYLGLWSAIKTYKPAHGLFSSWVKWRIRSAVGQLRKARQQLPYTLFSELDASKAVYNGNVTLTCDDWIGDPKTMDFADSVFDGVSRDILLELAACQPTEKQRQVCEDRINGHTYEEIAMRQGFSKQRGQQIWYVFVKDARQKLKSLEYDVCYAS